MNQEKLIQFLNTFKTNEIYRQDARAFYAAICYVQLGDFTQAQKLFSKSCKGMLKKKLWETTSQPNWLVDICILAGNIKAYPKVLQALENYKSDYRGKSLYALYAYSVMSLITQSGLDVTEWTQELLKHKKVKDTYAMGQSLQAICDKDKEAFNEALRNLLKAHEGMAKYGGLRETPEGWLSMSAMSLAYVASKHDLVVNTDSLYFSKGYLEYLLSQRNVKRLWGFFYTS